MDAVGKGFAVCEIVWDVSESQWMPEQLLYRLPQWFRYDWETGMRLQRRDDTHQWVDLEPGKFVVHRNQAKSGLPIRDGLARAAAWAWAFKNFGIRDWLRFVEAYGHPLRLGKFHRGATDAEQSTLYRAVRNIASDAAAIVPEGMAIEFVESSVMKAMAPKTERPVPDSDSPSARRTRSISSTRSYTAPAAARRGAAHRRPRAVRGQPGIPRPACRAPPRGP